MNTTLLYSPTLRNELMIPDTLRNSQWKELLFLCILVTLIICGNMIVILAIALSKKGLKSRMNYFILHLAFADLSVGFFSVLPDIYMRLKSLGELGSFACGLVHYVQCLAMFASTYVLVCMTIDRCDAILRPLNFSSNELRSRILVTLAWSISFVFSLPTAFINEVHIINNNPVCSIHVFTPLHWKIYVVSLASALFFLPGIIITACYILIIVTIFRVQQHNITEVGGQRSSNCPLTSRMLSKDGAVTSAKNVDAANRSNSAMSSRGVIPRAKIRTIKMTLVIVIAFVICWSPYFVFNTLDVFSLLPATRSTNSLRRFVQTMSPLNSAANPFIYGMFCTRVCRNLRKLKVFNWISEKIFCADEIEDSESLPNVNYSLQMNRKTSKTFTSNVNSTVASKKYTAEYKKIRTPEIPL